MNKVELKLEGPIAVVTICNPPVNALDAQVIDEIEQVFDDLSARAEVLAVVLTGAGEKAFVAGADISQFPSLKRESGRALSRKGQTAFQKIADLPVPVICAVNGFALGGGLELALACDIRVVAENARLGLPETSLGIIPGYGGTQRLTRVVGPSMAKKLIFSAAPVDAVEALHIGLADEVTQAGKSLEEALKLAGAIVRCGPVAVKTAKRAIDRGSELALSDALRMEAQEFGLLCETSDKNEGAAAFLEKRKPSFLGK